MTTDDPAISGRRVLVIAISRADPRQLAFVSGLAILEPNGIRLVDKDRDTVFFLRTPRELLRGFYPEVLPNLLVPAVYREIEQTLHGIEVCLAVFVETLPTVGQSFRDALFGLGQTSAGRPLLFQGEPELFHDAPDPWAQPPLDPGDDQFE